MIHYIKHTYDEILTAACPGLEIHVEYFCESEIEFDEDGERDPYLLSLAAKANGALFAKSFTINSVAAPIFPRETDGKEAREFLAKLRENARQALWARAIEAAKEAGYNSAQDISAAAETWQRTGKAALAG